MKYQGTTGQIRVIPVDPNNSRIALDSPNGNDVAGIYNQVTVDSGGRVVSGKFVNPSVIPGGSLTGAVTQICLYINNPNSEGVKPQDVTQPAICYSLNPANNMMLWNTVTKAWQ